jgi:EAL domain-containing protein (putative c-di-GMP-specific phosphodiesterase class I)/GGDEF domain-containing protein
MSATEGTPELSFIVLTTIGQALVAAFLCALFAYHWRRSQPRPHFRLWAASCGAMLLYVIGAGWSFALASHGRALDEPARFVAMTLSLAAAHAQMAWLVLGTLWIREDRPPARWLEVAVVGGAAAFGALLSAVYAANPGDDEVAMVRRLAWLFVMLGVAYAACGIRLFLFGGALRLTGGALAAFGLFKLGFVAMLASDDAALPLVSTEAVMTLDLIGFAIAGIALAISLFEVERQRAEEAQASLASLLRFDPITGLANRVRLNELWPSLRGTSGGLVVIELDGLERAAAEVPRARFERSLRLIANRLSHDFGSERVAELERERFVVVLSGDAERVRELARAALQAIEAVLDASLPQHEVLASGGLALFSGEEELAPVLARAVSGCEQARRAGGARLIDTARAPAQRTDRVVTLRGLRAAIERREFEMLYQPIVSTRGRQLVGFEALVRWQHPGEGQIGSNRFLEAIERFGLAAALDREALALTLDAILGWREQGFRVPRVAVNLSAASLESQTLASEVLAALEARALPTSQIAVELTESAAPGDYAACRRNLAELHAAGVKISLDDFGTGYSSVAHLRDLAVDSIKLDQSFMRRADRDPRDAALVRGLAQLAHSLGLSVVAEGIERESQAGFAEECGIEAIQGFLVSGPLPAAAALESIRAARVASA